MAFTPILTDQAISTVAGNTNYRNLSRENYAYNGITAGSPVYFVPPNYTTSQTGYGGPRYQSGPPYYNYNNSPQTVYNGNCTWWCYGRLLDTTGQQLDTMMTGSIHDAKNWYANFTGTKSTNASNIKAGDIIVLSDANEGHVMFVEQVTASDVYISQSAWSSRAVWIGYACRVTSYAKSDIYAGHSINMYKDIDSTAAYETVVGVIHTGTDDPTPPTPTTEDLEITISPTYYSVTMQPSEDFVDFTFAVAVSGIPAGQTISGGNTYPDLVRVYNTGWSYTDYVVNGVTYRRANKTQTLRYYRSGSGGYNTVKHMYFSYTFSTGTASTDTPMYITVKAKSIMKAIMGWASHKRRRAVYEIK